MIESRTEISSRHDAELTQRGLNETERTQRCWRTWNGPSLASEFHAPHAPTSGSGARRSSSCTTAGGVARQSITRDRLPDPGAWNEKDLQPRARRHRLGQELGEDLTGAFIGTNKRRNLEGKCDRVGLVEDLGLGIEAAIGKAIAFMLGANIGAP